MFFLLSSDYSPRYKQDVLRCLAAPIGGTIQFRYDKVHIPTDLLQKLTNDSTQFPLEGIVCSVASQGEGVLPLVPVRQVSIQRPRVHGETISVNLIVDQVVVANSSMFTSELDRLSNHKTPRIQAGAQSPEGFYFFEADAPAKMEMGVAVSLWERAVSTLREQHAYKDESFFWVTLGIEHVDEPFDTSELHVWASTLEPRQQFRLLVYHFQPRGGARPNSQIEVALGNLLQSVTPPDTKIDSRYDLKSWWFSTSDNALRPRPTWIRIRTADTWDMDLVVTVGASYWKPVVSGVLVGIPAVLALIPQNLDSQTKILLGVLAVLVGIGSSLLASSRSQ